MYQKGQPFSENHLKPCPMLENPDALIKLVNASGAHSTDLQSPENVCDLCKKFISYSDKWSATADKLMKNNPNQKISSKGTLPNK